MKKNVNIKIECKLDQIVKNWKLNNANTIKINDNITD